MEHGCTYIKCSIVSIVSIVIVVVPSVLDLHLVLGSDQHRGRFSKALDHLRGAPLSDAPLY